MSRLEFIIDGDLQDKSKLKPITYISTGGVTVTRWEQKKRRYKRMLNVQGKVAVNGWVSGMLKEFKLTKAGNHIMAIFSIDGQGADTASMLISNPVKLSDLNKIRKACGLPDITDPSEIQLPTADDFDMLGYDKPISIKIKQNGDFMNAEEFRPGNTVSASDFSSMKKEA